MDSSPAINFKCLTFQELSLPQLYELLALRQEVFIVEQNCPYLDADGKDQAAFHLLGYDENGRLATYSRILKPGQAYPDYAVISRVITRASVRRSGVGRLLLQESIDQINRLFPGAGIKISAQCYLTSFYESFGFVKMGKSYLEDGIPHIAMTRSFSHH